MGNSIWREPDVTGLNEDRKVNSDQLYTEFSQKMQQFKMKELWDNPEDDIWDKFLDMDDS